MNVGLLSRRWLYAALLAMAVMAVHETASAQANKAAVSDADKERALEKYNQGVEAFAQHRYKDAVDYFLAGDAIARSASFAYNIMLAYEQMGDAALALRWGREYLRRKPGAPDADDVKKRDAAFEQQLQKKGVQQVTIASNVDGATAVVDHTAVGVTPWTSELTPGNHRLALQKRGYADAELHFALADTHAMDVRLEMSPAVAPPPVVAPAAIAPSAPAATVAPAAPSPREPGPRLLSVVAWSGFGLGAASLVVATATGGASLAKQSAIRSHCPDHACSADLQADHDRVIALANASNAFFVIGGAAIVTGTVALIFDLHRRNAPEAAPASAYVRPLIGLGAVGVEGRF